MHSISLHNDVNWVQNDDKTVVLANCQLLFWARVAMVASPFSLLLGETDVPAPVRAKEWVWERGRVRIARLRLVRLGTPTPHLSPLPLPRGEVE
jgi:hypothetical protein